MKKLFLASMFSDVADLLRIFVGEDLSGKSVTFIPTASVPEKVKFYVGAARKAFNKSGIIVDELDLLTASHDEILNKLKTNDYIYISGGNTFFLLQELRRTGADKLIIEQINSGKCYIGESAGSMILSPNIEYVKYMDEIKEAPGLSEYAGLSVVDFYPVPHFKNFPFAKAVEKIISIYDSELNLYPISNHQVILVDGDTIIIENQQKETH